MVVILIVLGVSGYRLATGDITWQLAFAGLGLGVLIGYILGRTAEIFWHVEEEHVASRVDALGAVFLALYIAVEVGKGWFFGHWLAGAELSAFNLVFLAGLLSGRVLSVRAGVREVLSVQGKLPSDPR